MRLNYDSEHRLNPVLLRDGHRIEFHLAKLDAQLYVLIMLAGPDQHQPDRLRQQGPYHALDQAGAAIRAISGLLEKQGYQAAPGTLPIWQLQAQSELRATRSVREQNQVDSSFIPLGVPPEPKD